MSRTHEVNPPKGPFERVLSRLSTKTARAGEEGGSGEPEFTTADMAAAAAGLAGKDDLASVILGVMLEDARSVNLAVQLLDQWGWLRWRTDWPDKQITGALHGRLAAAVVADYQAGSKGYTIKSIREYLRCSGRRFTSLVPHWATLQRRLYEAEGELVQHLRRQLSRETRESCAEVSNG